MLPLLLLLAAPTLKLDASVDGAAQKPGWVYARAGQKVVLHAAVSGATARSFSWFQLEPTDESVDNTQPAFHFAQIAFRAVELPRCSGKRDCEALVPGLPSVPGVGTLAFQVKATLDDGRELITPGLDAMKWGGLTPQVQRVTFRMNDSYLGYLTELVGTPYIFGSAGPDGRNQSDLLIGADCADLAVYGRRRLGKKAEYTSTWGIDGQAPQVAKAVTMQSDGKGLDEKGRPIAPKPGDLLHFPASRHVAVFWEDRPPLGVLDAGDLMLHTCWAPPKIEPIGSNAMCATLPWRLLRFKD